MGYIHRFNFQKAQARGCDHFIETGTGKGWGTDYMIRQGFHRIDTVEQSPILVKWLLRKYRRFGKKKHNLTLNIYEGRSTSFLQTINDYSRSIVFLDAHLVGGADFKMVSHLESIPHKDSFPLLKELEILSTKDVSEAVIIIDDARMYYKELMNAGICPELLRQWDKHRDLQLLLAKFLKTHDGQVIDQDQGYVVLVPKGMPMKVVYNLG